MRIALFCNEYPPRQHGGIGTFTTAYVRGLLAAGHEPVVVEFGPAGQTRLEDGIRVVTLKVPPKRLGTTDLRLRFSLWRWASAEASRGHLDVFELPDFDGMMPFPLRRCASVVRLHLSRRVVQNDLGGKKSFKFDLFEGLTLRCNRNWIGVSRHVLQHTQDVFGIRPYDSEVILNPVSDPDLLERVPAAANAATRTQPYILFVGYVGERKGAFVLTEAARTLFSKHLVLQMVFVGKEDEIKGRPASETIRAILGTALGGRAHFTGPRPHTEVLEWMRKAAVICLPSRSESFGLVPVEGMMLGRPVVYSARGPGPEIVDDGTTGQLCDPYNAHDVAAKIDLYLCKPEWAEVVGANAKRIAHERFSMEQCITRSIQFYQKLLTEGGKGGGR